MKPKILVRTKGMSREEWLEWRRKGFGGSDVPTLLGLNQYFSIAQLVHDKRGELEDREAGEAAYWGNTLEDVVAKEFTKRTGKKLQKRNVIYQHPEYPWMLANLDRVVMGEDAGWEGKTTNMMYRDDGICPEYYAVQVQHYMAVANKSLWYVSVLAGGQKYFTYPVKRDDNFINNTLIPLEKKMWELVQSGDTPPPDGTDAYKQLLGDLYPEATAGEIELPIDTFDLLGEYTQLKEQEKDIKGRLQLIENTVKSQMGENERAYLLDRKIFWANVTTNRFDAKAFEQDHPELHKEYLKEQKSRRFQIK